MKINLAKFRLNYENATLSQSLLWLGQFKHVYQPRCSFVDAPSSPPELPVLVKLAEISCGVTPVKDGLPAIIFDVDLAGTAGIVEVNRPARRGLIQTPCFDVGWPLTEEVEVEKPLRPR